MNIWSCGLSVRRTPTRPTCCFVANCCQKGSSTCPRPSPFEPGTRIASARTGPAVSGSHSRNSALSKFAPGAMVSSKLAAAAEPQPQTRQKTQNTIALMALLRCEREVDIAGTQAERAVARADVEHTAGGDRRGAVHRA